MANKPNKNKKRLNIRLVGNQEQLIAQISKRLGYPPNIVLGMVISVGLPQILKNIAKSPSNIA